MKNWRQFVFCNNKISKKSNIAGKNEQNVTKFMTLTCTVELSAEQTSLAVLKTC